MHAAPAPLSQPRLPHPCPDRLGGFRTRVRLNR